MAGAAGALAPRGSDSRAQGDERPRPAEARDGSRIADASGDLEPVEPPSVYQVVYRVQDWAGGQLVETTDTITVERPYRGRVEIRTGGAPSSKAPRSRTSTDFGRISIDGQNADALLVATPPALAAGDLRFDAILADAVAAGRMMPREHRGVGGRRCRVYRTLEPIAAGTLTASAATARDYTDNCFAADGLLLEELWVTEGRVLRRRIATAVDRNPPVAGDIFDAFGTLLDPKQGGGSIRAVDPTSAPPGGPFWGTLAVPNGFTYRGRYAIVPPQREETPEEGPQASPFEGSESRKRVGAVADVWERGIDVLILEQGGAVDNSDVYEVDPGEPTFEVPGLGTGQVVLDGRLNEVRFPLPSGRYVRLLGTLSADTLRGAAMSLRAEGEGTGLVYLDAPSN